jgi:dTDP-4-amino-4,6-dideoxygalactose transaminase
MGNSSDRIPYVNLQAQWKEEKDDLLPIIEKVLSSGQYVGGEELDKFEKNIAKLCGVKYATGLNSGTDALIFALQLSGIGKGDEVITPPNSFIAPAWIIVDVEAINELGGVITSSPFPIPDN